jgi:competence protein ComEC
MGGWLAPQFEGRDIALVGIVSALPALMDRGVRFELDVESADDGLQLPGKVLISWWYRGASDEDAGPAVASAVHAGERWAVGWWLCGFVHYCVTPGVSGSRCV